MWHEKGQQIQLFCSPLCMRAGRIKWPSGIEKDSDASVYTDLSDKDI